MKKKKALKGNSMFKINSHQLYTNLYGVEKTKRGEWIFRNGSDC